MSVQSQPPGQEAERTKVAGQSPLQVLVVLQDSFTVCGPRQLERGLPSGLLVLVLEARDEFGPDGLACSLGNRRRVEELLLRLGLPETLSGLEIGMYQRSVVGMDRDLNLGHAFKMTWLDGSHEVALPRAVSTTSEDP